MKNIILLCSTIIIFVCCNNHHKKTKKKPTTHLEKIIHKQVAVYGIDISKYQGKEIQTLTKKQDSISFIICKATEGITYTDPKFSYNWTKIKQKSFLRGAYHFYRSNDNPIQQANNFLSAISSTIKKTDIPPIIDFEMGGIDHSKSIQEIQFSLKSLILQIEKKLNCTPIIYTSVNTGNIYLNNPYFANYPLWIANYDDKNSPNLPKTWKEKGWTLWQKTDSYNIENSKNDLDRFNGSIKLFKQFIENSWK